MHTHYGLKHFLAENERLGLKYIFKDVTKFPTINQEAGVILRQTLPNGVTRLQFPREAFSRSGWKTVSIGPKQDNLLGVKSLYPRSTQQKDLISAANKLRLSRSGEFADGYVDGIRSRFRFDKELNVTTAFPY